MTQERFLSVFETYILRTRGCTCKTAKDYKDYLGYINFRAINMLGYPDYLKWIAECSRYDCIKKYINLLKKSIYFTSTKRHEISNWESAVTALEQFIDELFRDDNYWPQFGKDESLRKVIRYKENADASIRVPGLCVDLKNEYIRIVDFAKHVFGDLIEEKEYDFIPVILNPDKPVRECPATEEYLDKLSRRIEERQDITKEENETLRTGIIRYSLLATFHFGANPRIEIFYCNTEARSREDYLTILKNCLAHEYMHYLHACYCNRIRNNDTYKDDEIREGVAEFFAMLFTLYRDGASDWLFAEKKYWSWAKMFNSGWPYACALYLYSAKGEEKLFTERIWDFKDNGCLDKLIEVFIKSSCIADAQTAFKI